MSKAQVTDKKLPDLPPPSDVVGPIHWIKENLFSSKTNILLTIISALLIYLLVPGTLDWLLISAVYTGGPEACAANPNGACWPFITAKWQQFVYGFYPSELRWRVDLALFGLVAGIAYVITEKLPYRRHVAIFMLTVYPLLAWWMMHGGDVTIGFFINISVLVGGIYLLHKKASGEHRSFIIGAGYAFIFLWIMSFSHYIVPSVGLFGIESVPTNKWGGFSLTLVIAITGIVFSLPLGVVLALGRRSNMPAIRIICVSFIEFWRGIPLISVLFMSSVMLPLFLPEGVKFNDLLRALIGVTLFSSAYMAEVIRGGLQAIPKGQYEGADSLGLTYWQKMRLIILPQALKIVIPGIVNTFIGLFKDTTLVLIIGLLDLLGTVQAGVSDATWSFRSVPYTGYAFTAIVFFISCYAMSIYSRKLEDKLHTGHKR